MHFLIPRAVISLLLLSSVQATTAGDTQHQLNTVEDVLSEIKPAPVEAGAAAGATNSEAVSSDSTLFNNIEVPPMKEINGEKFEEEIKNGYWYDFAMATLNLEGEVENEV